MSQFDAARPVTLTGNIVELKLINPHSSIVFDAADERGTIRRWHIELGAASALRNAGWNEETLKSGQRITVVGAPAGRECGGQRATRSSHHAYGFEHGDLRQGTSSLAFHLPTVSTVIDRTVG